LLWALGTPIEPLALFEGREARLVTLPPTPIEKQPYWAIERHPSSSEPIALATPAPLQNGADMDPLVALFREQIALLQAQAKVVQQQAEALAQRGVTIPQDLREALTSSATATPTSTSTSTSTSTANATATPTSNVVDTAEI